MITWLKQLAGDVKDVKDLFVACVVGGVCTGKEDAELTESAVFLLGVEGIAVGGPGVIQPV